VQKTRLKVRVLRLSSEGGGGSILNLGHREEVESLRLWGAVPGVRGRRPERVNGWVDRQARIFTLRKGRKRGQGL